MVVHTIGANKLLVRYNKWGSLLQIYSRDKGGEGWRRANGGVSGRLNKLVYPGVDFIKS